LAGSACRWHAQGAAHHGAAAAGARRQRSLTVFRQVAISLAGFANDPANLLFLLRRSPHPAGRLADGERVCSNLFEEARWSSSAHKSSRPRVRRAPAIGHDGNRIRVLSR
jgi:hypothetical protein